MAPFTAGEMIYDQTPSATSHRHARAKYRMLSPETKMRAIAHADKFGIKEAANLYKVPTKSLKRWLKVGFLRKKGGGRKTKDPDMEKLLYQWYLELFQ